LFEAELFDYSLLDLIRFCAVIAALYCAHWLFAAGFGMDSRRAWHLAFAIGIVLVGLSMLIKKQVPIEFGDREVGLLRGRDAILVGAALLVLGAIMIVQTLRP
jgi:hypothetical protein